MQSETDLFENIIDCLSEISFSADDSDFLIELLSMAEKCQLTFVEFGQNADDILNVKGNKSPAVVFCSIYEWNDAAKAFLLLIRQSIFEFRKALILNYEKDIDDVNLSLLKEETAKLIHTSADEIKEKLIKIFEVDTDKNFFKKKRKWLLQKSPWPVYKEQLIAVYNQCEHLISEFEEMKNTLNVFKLLRKLIINDIENSYNILLENKENFNYLKNELDALIQNNNHLQFEQSLSHIVHLEARIRQASFHDDFSDKAFLIIKELPTQCSWALDQEFGILYQADTTLQKNVKSWLENEILPLINEIWELTEGSSNGLRMLTYNLGIQLKSALSDTTNQNNLTFNNEKEAINQLCKDVGTSEQYIQELNKLATNRVLKVLCLKTAFNKTDLFGANKSLRFNNYFWQSNRLLDVAQIWLKNQWKKIL